MRAITTFGAPNFGRALDADGAGSASNVPEPAMLPILCVSLVIVHFRPIRFTSVSKTYIGSDD